MLKKVMIQVMSVLTLILGTVLPSASAIAATSGQPVEANQARLVDSKGQSLGSRVKTGTVGVLFLSVTVSPGDSDAGEVTVWLPKDQLAVTEKKLPIEVDHESGSGTVEVNRQKRKLTLSWFNVTNPSVFNVEIPVTLGQPMTRYALPIVVGKSTTRLAPMEILGEDATTQQPVDESQWPSSIVDQLAQAEKEAQASSTTEQAKTSGNGTADTASSATTESQTAQNKADQAAEEQKAKAVLKARSQASETNRQTSRSREDVVDGDIGPSLGKDVSFFDKIVIQYADGTTEEISHGATFDLSKLKDQAFTIQYHWNTKSLETKLGFPIEVGDNYTFRVYGVTHREKEIDDAEINSNYGVVGTYSVRNGGAGSSTYQEVTLTLTDDRPTMTPTDFVMSVDADYQGFGEIVAEYRDEAIVEIKPEAADTVIAKEGQFVGDGKIKWTMTLDEEKWNQDAGSSGRDVTKLSIVDSVIGSGHELLNEDLKVIMANGDEALIDVSDYFKSYKTGKQLTIEYQNLTEEADLKVTGNLIFTVYSQITGTSATKFVNGAQVYDREDKVGEQVEATLSAYGLDKTLDGYEPASGKYSWIITVDLSNYAITPDLLEKLLITDTLKGPQEFRQMALNLNIMVGTNQVTDTFAANASGSLLTLKPLTDSAKIEQLVAALESNKKLVVSFDSYAKHDSDAGDLSDIGNEVAVELDSLKQKTGALIGRKFLVTKTGALDYSKSTNGKAMINWTIRLPRHEYRSMTIVDVLPSGVVEENVSNLRLNGREMAQYFNYSYGYSNGTIGIDGLYDFNYFNFNRNFSAIQFTLGWPLWNSNQENVITYTTEHDWPDSDAVNDLLSHTNKVSARTTLRGESLWEQSEATVNIPSRIAHNGFKDGKLNLANTPEQQSTVQWTVAFGTRWNTEFGSGGVEEVTVTETINEGTFDYLKYLQNSDGGQLRLHKVTSKGTALVVEEDAIDPEKYDIKLEVDENNPNKAKFIITFKGTDTYERLALRFNTAIDWDAWKASDPGVTPVQPERAYFNNEAVVEYGDETFKKVEAKLSASLTGVYSDKTGRLVNNGSTIDWDVILNADAATHNNVEISDVLEGNHVYDIRVDSFNLYTADVRTEMDSNGRYVPVVVESTKQLLERDKDYVISPATDGKSLTINLINPLTKPLLMRYSTLITEATESGTKFSNGVKMTSKEYETSATDTQSLEASAFLHCYVATFFKTDEHGELQTGAVFKLEQWNATDNKWETAVNMLHEKLERVPVTPEGWLQFAHLARGLKYRAVEISAADGYEPNITPIEFDHGSYDAIERTIQNYPEGEKGHLTIRKVVGPNVAQDIFKFTIRAVNEDGKVDTNFNGVYDTDGSDQKMIFKSGEASFSLVAGQEVTVLNLPIYKTDNETKWQYVVEENVAEGSSFKTAVAVGDTTDYLNQTKSPAFTLVAEDRQFVTFRNVNEIGNFILSKHTDDPDGLLKNETFEFQIKADGSYTSEEGELEGSLQSDAGVEHADVQVRFDNGKMEIKRGSVWTESITFGPGQNFVIKGLPIGIKLAATEIGVGDYNVSSLPQGSVAYGNYKTEEVTIKDNTDVGITITNAPKVGDLTVKKTVKNGLPEDDEQEFEFTIDANDKNFTGTYDVTGNAETNSVKFVAGETTITLKGGEVATLKHLPADMTFTITEKLESGFTTSWRTLGNESGDGNVANVTTTSGKERGVTFTNTRHPRGSLRLEKIGAGKVAKDAVFSFVISTKAQVEGEYTAKVMDKGSDLVEYTLPVEFIGNEVTVNLEPGQVMVIDNLPLGDYQVSENDPGVPGMTTTWTANGQPGDGLDASELALADGHQINYVFVNTLATGNFALSKWVSGPTEADLEREFEFNLQANDSARLKDGKYPALRNGQDTEVVFTGGHATVYLRHGDTLELPELPDGIELTVTETVVDGLTPYWALNTGKYEDYDAQHAPVVTIGATTQHLRFKNEREATAELQLNKTVTGHSDLDKAYKFTVMGADGLNLAGPFLLERVDETGKVLETRKDVSFTGQTLDLNLTHGQTVRLSGLPMGDYTVTEADPEITDMTTSWSVNGASKVDGRETDAVTLSQNSLTDVHFTNRVSAGELMLEKQLAGAVTEADHNRDFTFALNFNDAAFTQTLSATHHTSTGDDTVSLKVVNGLVDVHLKSGERLTIHGLTDGRQVQVRETNGDGFVTTHKVGTAATAAGAETDVLTVSDAETLRVVFVNTREEVPTNSWLALSKSVTGLTDADAAFDFTVRFTDADQQPVTGLVNYVKLASGADDMAGQLHLDKKGQATLSLRHGETMRFELPNGAGYQIEETDYSMDGYTTTVAVGNGAPQATSLVTGVVHNDASGQNGVHFINAYGDSAETEAHTPADPELLDTPGFSDGGISGGTTGTTLGGGGTTPTGGSTPEKGILPQTGEALAANWLVVLAGLLGLFLAGIGIWLQRKKTD